MTFVVLPKTWTLLKDTLIISTLYKWKIVGDHAKLSLDQWAHEDGARTTPRFMVEREMNLATCGIQSGFPHRPKANLPL
jgi:hypothetical protein